MKWMSWTLPWFVLLPAAAMAQTCVPPPSGIIAWWPFDETGGTIANDIAGEHPGVYFDGPTPVAGLVGGALRFNGDNSFVGAADSDLWAFGQSDFTIEFWASFDQLGSGSVGHPGDIFIGNDEGPTNRSKWFFALGGGFLNFHINSPALGPRFFPLAPFSPETHRWYHLALTRNGSLYTIFVDGRPAASVLDSNAIPNPASSLTIGQAESLGFMHGSLDEVTVYNRALTGEEIRALAAAGDAGKCKAQSDAAPIMFPSAGGDTGTVTVRIDGNRFTQSTTARLAHANQPDIPGKLVNIADDGKTITTSFDLKEKLIGSWDLLLTDQETTRRFPGVFSIQSGKAAQIWTDIIGLSATRAGQFQKSSILIGNRGNIDLKGGFVWISGIPTTAHILAYRASNQPLPTALTSFGALQEQVIPLFALDLPPGHMEVLDVYIKSTTAEPFTIRVETMP